MNVPGVIGVLLWFGLSGAVYAFSHKPSVWPRFTMISGGVLCLFLLDLPWQATVTILVGAGVVWSALHAFNRVLVGPLPEDEAPPRAKQGLGDDWKRRFGGDGASGNWRKRRQYRHRTGAHADDPTGKRRQHRYKAGAKTGGGARRRRRKSGAMDRDEALRLLGLDEMASERDIKRAHRRLMKKHHPDRGGSTEMAARLNRARERLTES